MANDLKEFVSGNPYQGFNSKPYYSPEGDFVSYFFRDADHYAHRVDQILTVYLSMKTRELVGFKVKGVRSTLNAFDSLGCPEITRSVPDGDKTIELTIPLRTLLVPGMAMARDPEHLERYKEIASAAKNVRVNRQELLAAT